MAQKAGLLVCIVVVLCMSSPDGYAQENRESYEIAGHFSLLLDRDTIADTQKPLAGGGGTFTYFPLKYMGLEAEYSLYPEREFIQQPLPGTIGMAVKNLTTNYNGPQHTAFFGIKAGMRTKKIGIFIKARPGFAVFHPVYDCIPVADILDPGVIVMNQCSETHKKEFALDFGGVIEGYLPHHTFVRFDAGDTYLKYGKTVMLFSGSGVRWINYPYGEDNRHHFQLKLGFGVRF
jgi:hypothetical protein